MGEQVSGDFVLTAGEMLEVAVGGAGSYGGPDTIGGGGGGSYDSGTNPLFSLATAGGNGAVEISFLNASLPTPVPGPASLALLGTGLAGLLARRRR